MTLSYGPDFHTTSPGGAEQKVFGQSAPDSQETRGRKRLCLPACHSKPTYQTPSFSPGEEEARGGGRPELACRSSVRLAGKFWSG